VTRLSYLHQEKIQYTDFLAATLDTKKYLDEESVYMAFGHFDGDGDGYISAADLKATLLGPESELCEDDIDEMIVEFDKNSDGRIDRSEFREMLENLNAQSMYGKGPSRVASRQRTMSKAIANYAS